MFYKYKIKATCRLSSQKWPLVSVVFSNNPCTCKGGSHDGVSRGGNRAGRAGLGLANSGQGQNRAWPKLAWFFRANILTAQPALKTGPVGPNSHFKAKKIRVGLAGLGHTGLGQIWPGFFGANNLMAQPGPNFGWTGLAHLAGPILPPLGVSNAQ